jgi:SAM-dependent methyltransferase
VKALRRDLATSAKDHYCAIYGRGLEKEAEWLRRGAGNKVDSIQQLLARRHIEPRRVVELGCGTGAVIEECQRRGLGREFAGVDYSAEAVGYLRDRCGSIDGIAADITAPGFRLDGVFELVILSHVLEHLEEPKAFLQSVVDRIQFSWIVIEVPLEDLPAGRLKARIRDRRINNAGHVQFFNRTSLRALLESNDLEVVDERRYAPVLDRETVAFLCAKNEDSRAVHLRTLMTGHVLPRLLQPLWTRLYYGHLAALCRKRTAAAAE